VKLEDSITNVFVLRDQEPPPPCVFSLPLLCFVIPHALRTEYTETFRVISRSGESLSITCVYTVHQYSYPDLQSPDQNNVCITQPY